MATIKSNYLGRDFEFEPANMVGDDGNPITIIPHNILFDIIQNRLTEAEHATYEYRTHLVSREHSFVECIISDRKGRCIRDFGESVPESLKSDIAKTIPGTMAAIRAFDRAAIRYLDFACDGKVYSDNEISTEGMKPAGNQKKQTGTQPASQNGAKGAPKADVKSQSKAAPKAATAPAPAASTFSMTVPGTSKLKTEVMAALSSHTEMIAFDTETTGVKPEDRIMEIAAKKFSIDPATGAKKLVDELQLYINPEKELDQAVVDLTGITNEFLADKPTEREAFIDIYNFFGENPQILCGYNTGFDVRFLSDLYKRQGKTLTCDCKLDVFQMAKELIAGAENYKLATIAGLFGMQGEDFHTASADTDYTVKLLDIFVAEYRKGTAPAPSAAAPAASVKEEPEPQNNTEAAGNGGTRPKIISMSSFAPSRSIRRIYVNTDAQTVYFDLVKKQWLSKDGDLGSIDMEYLEKEAWKIAGADSIEAFEAFNGKWSAEPEQKAA